MPPQSKISQLRDLMDSNQWEAAIKYAAKFPRLEEQREAILSASGAITNPRFYKQIGKDPTQLIQAGKKALLFRYAQKKAPKKKGGKRQNNIQ